MAWQVVIHKKMSKKVSRLPAKIRDILNALIAEIKHDGPVRGNWPNYGKLDDTRHHCHIREGKPCYVAVWEVTDKKIHLVEVNYVGTHEKAPY
jgi:mRNA-degrading endonuclease RelE of RelBE toxin-antitoxin system